MSQSHLPSWPPAGIVVVRVNQSIPLLSLGCFVAKGPKPGPGASCFRKPCMHACKPRAPGAGGRSPSPSICTRCPAGCLGHTFSPAPTPRGTRRLPSAGRLTGLEEGGACRLRDTARGGQGCERSLSTHMHSSERENPVPKDSIRVLPGFARLFSESPDPNSCRWALSLPMRLRQLILP